MNLNVDWPGWPLAENPYGDEFDEAARGRMVEGARLLLPLIQKHRVELGKTALEIGPFFDPLITPETFPGLAITYLDNDRNALEYLQSLSPAGVIDLDLNSPHGTQKIPDEPFDSVIISQVFNYVDYYETLAHIHTAWLKKDGLLFLNNVCDYGIPALFSKYAAHRDSDVLESFGTFGLEVLERQDISFHDQHGKELNRLLLVARHT